MSGGLGVEEYEVGGLGVIECMTGGLGVEEYKEGGTGCNRVHVRWVRGRRI